MPNIAEALKAEIARVARKEVRAETAGLKKAHSAQRHDIAALKKLVQELEKQLRRIGKAGAKEVPVTAETEPTSGLRFSAKGFASRRKALGLSAHDFGLLIGTTGQSVYAWETGKARPRAKYLPAIAALRALGKKEAAARLDEIRADAK